MALSGFGDLGTVLAGIRYGTSTAADLELAPGRAAHRTPEYASPAAEWPDKNLRVYIGGGENSEVPAAATGTIRFVVTA